MVILEGESLVNDASALVSTGPPCSPAVTKLSLGETVVRSSSTGLASWSDS
jgi:NhaP-type Na+/H+ or K+/H+ antiporter